jgi:hypothetical protein
MKIKTRRAVRDYVVIDIDDEHVELEVRLRPGEVMHHIDYVIERPAPDLLVIGYLIEDPDCHNPLEDCDGMGRIYSANRRVGREDHAAMQKALGLNEHWEPAIDDEMWAKAEQAAKEKDLADISPSYDKIMVEALPLWREARKRGEIGNPYAVSLDVYEHGGVMYSVSGEGMQCRWDTARGGAVWVPDDSCKQHIESFPPEERAAKAQECARQACEEYNKWLAGDCYGRIVVPYRRVDGEWTKLENDDGECWGFIGHEYAEQELKDACKAEAKWLLEKGQA